jgi:transposase
VKRQLHLDVIESLEAAVAEVDTHLGEALAPFRDAVARIDAVPGINIVTAQAILGEIGPDMSRFPTHQHLLSWACACPRLDESAGKRKSTRTRKGAAWLKTVMVQAAWAAVSRKNTYYRAQFFRLRARRGPKKAIVAVAASMLTAIYYILRDGVAYHELGGQYFEHLDRSKVTQRLVKRLRDLGYAVQLDPVAA